MKTYKSIQDLVNANQNFSYLDIEKINRNISSVLNCDHEETNNYEVLTGGYMNPVFIFSYDGQVYVYRYPGAGSEKIVNRQSEYAAHKIATEIGLDDSLVWIDEEGHKISKFINDYRYFNYEREDDVKTIVSVMRELHQNETLSTYKYDKKKEINKFYETDKDYALEIYPDLSEIKETIDSIYETLNYDDAKLSLCHNDIYTTNILMTDDKLYLIDWEFANDTHPALDLTTFLVCSPYSESEIEDVLKLYLKEDYTETVIQEYYRYFSVGALYWLLWALHVESNGGDTEGFVQKYYHYLTMFLNKVKRAEGEQ